MYWEPNNVFGPFLFFLWPLFLFSPESHPDLWGNHSLHHPFLTWDNALIMMIITLLFTYNSWITTQYLEQNMTLYECLRRCTGICNDSWVISMKELWTVALPQILCQLHDRAKWCLLHNLLLVDVVGPPSAEVCRTVANFPQVDDLRFINP